MKRIYDDVLCVGVEILTFGGICFSLNYFDSKERSFENFRRYRVMLDKRDIIEKRSYLAGSTEEEKLSEVPRIEIDTRKSDDGFFIRKNREISEKLLDDR
jgi:hypothetical protein